MNWSNLLNLASIQSSISAGSFFIFPKTSLGLQDTDCKEKIKQCLGTSWPGEVRMCSPHVSGPICDEGCGAGECKTVIIN